jgi:hypothetical protein
LAVDCGEVQGVIASRSLKPSEAVTDMMIFEVPLENAKQFVLSADPNFWRPTGEQRLAQISNDSFRLEFNRADIK